MVRLELSGPLRASGVVAISQGMNGVPPRDVNYRKTLTLVAFRGVGLRNFPSSTAFSLALLAQLFYIALPVFSCRCGLGSGLFRWKPYAFVVLYLSALLL